MYWLAFGAVFILYAAWYEYTFWHNNNDHHKKDPQ